MREVWERDSQVDAEGKRYIDLRDNDGNRVRVYWEKGHPRQGEWDMGHVAGQEYRKLREDYLDHKISKDEFLEQYKDSGNYEVQLPSVNRSRKLEAP